MAIDTEKDLLEDLKLEDLEEQYRAIARAVGLEGNNCERRRLHSERR